MTDLRKAAEMALEALENIDRWLPTIGQRGLRDYEADAIQALRQALAEDALKTVADIDHSIGLFIDSPSVDAVNISEKRVHKTDKSIHEPVAYEFIPNGELLYPHELERRPDANYVPLYTAPPKREWVGLTDEDYDELMLSGDWGGSLIQATQAKLKEKNT